MKLTKTASGKTTVKMSKSEWVTAGRKAGWLTQKEAGMLDWLGVSHKARMQRKKRKEQEQGQDMSGQSEVDQSQGNPQDDFQSLVRGFVGEGYAPNTMNVKVTVDNIKAFEFDRLWDAMKIVKRMMDVAPESEKAELQSAFRSAKSTLNYGLSSKASDVMGYLSPEEIVSKFKARGSKEINREELLKWVAQKARLPMHIVSPSDGSGPQVIGNWEHAIFRHENFIQAQRQANSPHLSW
jgi:hypothetical protein